MARARRLALKPAQPTTAMHVANRLYAFSLKARLHNIRGVGVPDGRILNRIAAPWRPRRDLNPCYRRERAMS